MYLKISGPYRADEEGRGIESKEEGPSQISSHYLETKQKPRQFCSLQGRWRPWGQVGSERGGGVITCQLPGRCWAPRPELDWPGAAFPEPTKAGPRFCPWPGGRNHRPQQQGHAQASTLGSQPSRPGKERGATFHLRAHDTQLITPARKALPPAGPAQWLRE